MCLLLITWSGSHGQGLISKQTSDHHFVTLRDLNPEIKSAVKELLIKEKCFHRITT